MQARWEGEWRAGSFDLDGDDTTTETCAQCREILISYSIPVVIIVGTYFNVGKSLAGLVSGLANGKSWLGRLAVERLPRLITSWAWQKKC